MHIQSQKTVGFTWNREERTKPRAIAGLARFFKGCGVPIYDRYIRESIKVGGYQPEFGNLTTANHFLKWKAANPYFRCVFKRTHPVSEQPRNASIRLPHKSRRRTA